MIEIIETNLLTDGENNILDHQSRIVEVESWNTYCKAFEEYNGENVHFKSNTMPGDTIPSNCKIRKLRRDNYHLSCIVIQEQGFKTTKLVYNISFNQDHSVQINSKSNN